MAWRTANLSYPTIHQHEVKVSVAGYRVWRKEPKARGRKAEVEATEGLGKTTTEPALLMTFLWLEDRIDLSFVLDGCERVIPANFGPLLDGSDGLLRFGFAGL